MKKYKKIKRGDLISSYVQDYYYYNSQVQESLYKIINTKNGYKYITEMNNEYCTHNNLWSIKFYIENKNEIENKNKSNEFNKLINLYTNDSNVSKFTFLQRKNVNVIMASKEAIKQIKTDNSLLIKKYQ